MLQLSDQVCENLAAINSRYTSKGIPNVLGASYPVWNLCIVLVSENVEVPSTHNGAINYINAAVNGSQYYGGTNSSGENCLAIIDKIPSATILANGVISYDGICTFTAKQSGKVGGAILTYMYAPANTYQSAIYPLTSATSQANAITYTGVNNADEKKIWNYLAITDSVGTSGSNLVIVESVDLVAGNVYNFYGASLKFSSQG